MHASGEWYQVSTFRKSCGIGSSVTELAELCPRETSSVFCDRLRSFRQSGIFIDLPVFAWMADKIFALARAICSAKYMIRANWSLVGGLRTEVSPTQAKSFQVARGKTPVAQMSFASQVPLA